MLTGVGWRIVGKGGGGFPLDQGGLDRGVEWGRLEEVGWRGVGRGGVGWGGG